MTPEAVSRLLEAVARGDGNLRSRLGARTEEVCEDFIHLRRSLDAALGRLEAHATVRQLRPVEAVDVGKVQKLVATGRLDGLSRREARYIVLSFSDFSTALLRDLLGLRAELWRTFARQLLLRWEVSMERVDWDDYAGVLAGLPPGQSPVDAPIHVKHLASRTGAKDAVAQLAMSTLTAVYKTLVEGWRLQPSWTVTGHILVEWCRRAGRGRDGGLVSSVRELMDTNGALLRALLLPGPSAQEVQRNARVDGAKKPVATAKGSTLMHVKTAAVMLRARFSPGEGLDEATFSALEPMFLRSTFGDPRTLTVSKAWSDVRAEVPEAYDAFLQGLVRDDLALFFQHLMREQDRERFWLRYLKSIRRTLCVLSPDGYAHLDRRLAGASETHRAALQRAARTRAADVDGASAFCLFFGEFVMVEFSVRGNAGYLYEGRGFEEEVLAMLRAGGLRSPAALKKLEKSGSRGRLVHRQGWQEVMDGALLERGIVPDRRRRGTG